MRKFIMLLIVAACSANLSAQDNPTQAIRRYVEVPREIIIQNIAVQPDCPVKLENVKYLVGTEGGGGTNSYKIRNAGTKPIIRVTVASSTGAINTYYNYGKVLIMPGQLMPEPKTNIKEEIIPLTNELREKLKLKGPMRSFVILMIANVEFADGTKFDDEKTFNALETYIQELGDAKSQYDKNKKVVQD